MPRLIRTAVIGMAASVLGATAALAGPGGGQTAASSGDFSMTIANTNETMTIERVWVAPAGQSNTPWEEVTLNHPILPNEESTFTVPASTGRCFYDVRMRFSDGGDATTGNVNVCRHDTLRAH